MERLIEFLLNNFYFVIVAVGLIYGMFFRKSPEEGKRPNRMPDFGGGGDRKGGPAQTPPPRPRRPSEASGERRSAPRPAARTELEEPRYGLPSKPEAPAPVRTAEPALASSPDVADPWGDAEPVRAAESGALERSLAATRAAHTAPKAAPPDGSVYAAPAADLQPTRDDLARAIVWSEILGPPRARKPYRR